MELRAKSLFSLFYIFFFALVIYLSLGYNAKARLIPLVVAVPSLVFSVAQLLFDLRNQKRKGRSIEDDLFHGIMHNIHQEVPAGAEEPAKKKRERSLKPFLSILAWIVGFYVAVYLFGFMITIPLYTVVFMRTHEESWKLAAACAAGTWAVIYVAFSVVAKITLHEGLVFTLLAAQ